MPLSPADPERLPVVIASGQALEREALVTGERTPDIELGGPCLSYRAARRRRPDS